MSFQFEPVLDRLKKMCNNTQHFHLNPIKLIKTSPGSILSQTIKKPSHDYKVHGA
jgi:hypothetical protein